MNRLVIAVSNSNFMLRLILILLITTPKYFLKTTIHINMNSRAANAYAISLSINPFRAILRLRKTAINDVMAATFIGFLMRFS